MAARLARTQVRPARRGQAAKASRGRQILRARAGLTAALALPRRAPRHPAQRGGRVRPLGQRAGPAGGGDESDSEDSHILDPPGDAGGVPAIHGQPGDLLAQLPGYRGVRVRLFLGGLPLAAGLLGQAALGDPAPPRAPPPACEHCHTIPYQKGVCCSNVGVRTECPKCHAMVWQGTLSMQCRVHCLCSEGRTVYAVQGALSLAQCTLSMYSGALSMCTGGTVHVHRGHFVEHPTLPTYHHHFHPFLLHNPICTGTCARWVMCTSTLSPPPPSIFLPPHTPQGLYGQTQSTALITRLYPSINFYTLQVFVRII